MIIKTLEVWTWDMKITRFNYQLSSIWYLKQTDTGLVMNCHSFAPLKYKRSVVSGFVHRIYRSYSTWQNIYDSLSNAKIIKNNNYRSSLCELFIRKALEKFWEKAKSGRSGKRGPKHMIRIQYRRKVSDYYNRVLRNLHAPSTVVFTLWKLKTTLPSLKVELEKALKSRFWLRNFVPTVYVVLYRPTDRYLLVRFKEHLRASQIFGKHIKECDTSVKFDDKTEVFILLTIYESILALVTHEAL